MLLNTPDVVQTTVLAPTSEKGGQTWRFTMSTPAEGWEKADFPLQRKDAIHTGRNVIAIHCKQSVGCQFIDAGIIVESAD